MRPKKLEDMSHQELVRLLKRVESLIAAKREHQRATMRKEIEAMAKAEGFHLDELFSSRSARAPRAAAGIKYRHPKDATLTWTGRGRRPKWLLDAGGNIERFRVA
jgi:DNA-binding protein H-NS